MTPDDPGEDRQRAEQVPHRNAAAAIIRAANHFRDDEALIDAVDVHTGRLDRYELLRVVDLLAVTLAMLTGQLDEDVLDRLAQQVANTPSGSAA